MTAYLLSSDSGGRIITIIFGIIVAVIIWKIAVPLIQGSPTIMKLLNIAFAILVFGGLGYVIYNYFIGFGGKFLGQRLSNPHNTCLIMNLMINLVTFIILFFCLWVRYHGFKAKYVRDYLEEKRAGVRFSEWSGLYYDNGERKFDTDVEGAFSRLTKNFGFWLLIAFYLLQLAFPILFDFKFTKETDFYSDKSKIIIGLIISIVMTIIESIIYVKVSDRLDTKARKSARKQCGFRN